MYKWSIQSGDTFTVLRDITFFGTQDKEPKDFCQLLDSHAIAVTVAGHSGRQRDKNDELKSQKNK